ncbi:ArsR/SmtB family transcription factor [Sciscionella sediminilitoris]|uniref:ArsR/SmtB family transcription factor n=1 Tax=Sciscionella sediminilitoris TaxID=1445613 RepID=UPI000562B1F1|nr:DUF5937 family protein [Sciscionella sp. SE31]
MAVVLDLHGIRPESVRTRCDAAAELMACLHVLAEPGHHPDRARWVREVRAGFPEWFAVELGRLEPLWARFRTRLLLPLTADGSGELDEAVAALQRLDVGAFTRLCADAVHGFAPSCPWQLDDAGGAREFVRACNNRSPARGALAAALVADPERVRERLLSVLLGAGELFFGALWPRLRSAMRGSVELLGERVRTGPLPLVVSSLSPTAEVDNAAQTVRFEKLQSARFSLTERELVLVPTRFGHPHLLVKGESEPGMNLPVLVQFPAEHTEEDSLEQVRIRLLALTDPVRLGLCRHLINEACTTTELATRTGMSPQQVSRHLRKLRDAGLVIGERQGRSVRYRIVLSKLYGLGHDLVTRIVR